MRTEYLKWCVFLSFSLTQTVCIWCLTDVGPILMPWDTLIIYEDQKSTFTWNFGSFKLWADLVRVWESVPHCCVCPGMINAVAATRSCRKYLEVPGEVRRWERLSWAKNLTQQTAALSHLDISVGNRNIPAMSNDFSFSGKLSRSWFEQKITGGWIHKYMNNSMFLFLTSAETRPWSWWSSSRPRSPPPGRRWPGPGRRSTWRWTDTRTRCNTRVTQSLSSLSPHLLSVSWLRARRGHCSTLKTSVDLTLSNKLAIMFDSRCSVFTV